MSHLDDTVKTGISATTIRKAAPLLTASNSLWPAVAAVAAALTFLVLSGQWLLLHRQARQQEAQLLSDLEKRWEALRRPFRIAVMTALGPEAYYAEATSEERSNYDRLIRLRELNQLHSQIQNARSAQGNLLAAYAEAEDRLGRPIDPKSESDFIFVANVLMEVGGPPPPRHPTHEELNDLILDHQESIRAVLLYLAFVSSLILRGHLSTRGVYEVIGPALVRRSAAMRTLMAEEGPWLEFRPGIEGRVRYLLDSIWSEAARAGELSSDEIAHAALLKRWTSSGCVARTRLRRLCAGTGTGYPRRIHLAARLAWAEVLPRERTVARP